MNVSNIIKSHRTKGLVILETAACLLGGEALFAMTRVYLLRTVPEWNTSSTPLEFVGSAILLGGSLGAVFTSFGATDPPAPSPALMTSGIGVLLGLMLKLAAITPALAADKTARTQTWYETAATPLSAGRVLAVRMGFNLVGLALILIAMHGKRGTSVLYSYFGPK